MSFLTESFKAFNALSLRLTAIVILGVCVGTLLLSWSSNHYIKEILTLKARSTIDAKEKIANIYGNFMEVSVKGHFHKERMYVVLNDLKIKTLSAKTRLNDIDGYEPIKEGILTDIRGIEKDITALRMEFRDLNKTTEDSLKVFKEIRTDNDEEDFDDQ